MKEKYKKLLLHLLIHFIAFIINYFVFVTLTVFINKSDAILTEIVNFIAWIVSMLYIFFMDKKCVPDLVDENNS